MISCLMHKEKNDYTSGTQLNLANYNSLYSLSNRHQTDRKSEKNLSDAVQKRETIALRLSKDALAGNDTLYEPSNVVKKISQKSSITKGYGY